MQERLNRDDHGDTRKHYEAKSADLVISDKQTVFLNISSTPPLNKKYELLRRELMEAVSEDDVTKCQAMLSKLKADGHDLNHPNMRDPATSKTALHVALEKKSIAVATYLIASCDYTFLMEDCNITVDGIPSRKTALHILALNGNSDLAKSLLSKIPESDVKVQFLERTVLMELEGQRPRQLPSIHIAALQGHIDFVKLLVDMGSSVDYQNTKHDTPILWATRGNHINLVRWLIEKGANVNGMNDKGSTALYWAVRYGFVELTHILLEQGRADVNMKRKLGLVCPIILASAFGNTEILELLIRYGANVNTQIRRGETALHHAAAWGNEDAIDILLSHTKDIDFADEKGDTAITLAAQSNEPNVVQLLVSRGADPAHKNQEGKNAWTYAIDADDDTLLKSLLTAYSSSPSFSGENIVFSRSKSPLHQAAAKGDFSKVSILLNYGISPITTDEQGNIFLHIAASENHTDVLKNFISKPYIDHQNKLGETPLHLACMYGHYDAVSLLTKSAKISVKNVRGETPLHVAAKSSSSTATIVRTIADAIVKTHNWSLLDEPDNEGNTALHLAAESGRISIIEELDDLNAKIVNHEGNTPLHVAAFTGKDNVLETMLDMFQRPGRDLDINQQNHNGDTLLHISALQSNTSRLQLLIKHGADLEKQNIEGNTVLHELIEETASEPEMIDVSSEMFDAIVGHSVWWWCNKVGVAFPYGSKDEFNNYQKKAIIYLTTKIYNNEGKNVTAFAIQNGVKELVSKILNIPDVFVFNQGKHRVYDVTNLTPDTFVLTKSQSRQKVGVAESSDITVAGRHADESYVSLIIEQPTKIATELLDITPICQVVENYWNAYQWVFVILMFTHITYMSLLSAYAVPLLKTGNATVPYPAYSAAIFPNIIFLVWPCLLLLFDLYYFAMATMKCCSRRRSQKDQQSTIGNVLSDYFGDIVSNIGSMIFSVSVITWFSLYCVHEPYQDIALAVALVSGWLYTIYYTKGFSNVHHFSVMLRYILVRDIVRFLVVYFFVLLAFSFALHALFQISQNVSDTYPTPMHTMFAVFNLMVGMWELFDDNFEQGYDNVGRSSVYVKIVYIFYICMATIILINLLIAMMNDSYTNVNSAQGQIWRVGSIQLALQIDRSVPILPKLLRKLKLKSKMIEYDKKKSRWLLSISNKEIKSSSESSENNLAKSFHRLEYRMGLMQNSFDGVLTQMNRLTTKMREIDNKLAPDHNSDGQLEVVKLHKTKHRKTRGKSARGEKLQPEVGHTNEGFQAD